MNNIVFIICSVKIYIFYESFENHHAEAHVRSVLRAKSNRVMT
jgi:hypothetical protein